MLAQMVWARKREKRSLQKRTSPCHAAPSAPSVPATLAVAPKLEHGGFSQQMDQQLEGIWNRFQDSRLRSQQAQQDTMLACLQQQARNFQAERQQQVEAFHA
ncbi:unnamed protein product [Symbiodinium natans]|uniref:Uncharacterized protein n=1 Tax=Symbiodinium natans TaxID=878477 RepID=A0A812JBF2_9DINO|nr:unnamed protein product [Symbiodinium natans]